MEQNTWSRNQVDQDKTVIKKNIQYSVKRVWFQRGGKYPTDEENAKRI